MIPAEKQAFMQQVRSLKKLVEAAENSPSSAVKSVLHVWQKKQFPLLCTQLSPAELKFAEYDTVVELARWLSQRPFLEAVFWLSSAYAIWVGNEVRSEKSLYFTPPLLAERLIDDLIDQGGSLIDDVWMDPACGGGAFLAPVAVRMIDALEKKNVGAHQIVKAISNNILGNDIDPTLSYLSTQYLLMALYKQIDISKTLPTIKISSSDGLLSKIYDDQKADVIICNPPYRKMKSVEVQNYIGTYLDVIEGQPNIYGLFIRQCLKMGKNTSLVGLLTPTSYLSGRYFSKLRQIILKEASVCQIDLVDDREGVFIDVSQGAVLSVFKRHTHELRTSDATEVYALSIAGKFTRLGSCNLSLCKDAWPIPRQQGDQEIIHTSAKSPYRLADYGFSARIGTYVDYRDTRKTYTKQPNNKTMKAVFPIIWSSDITPDGKLVHGRTSKKDGHHIFIEMGTKDHRAVIRRPAIAMQRVTSPDQPRRLVCAEVDDDFMARHEGVVGENHVIFLEQTSRQPPVSKKQFAALLGSEPIDRLFRSISGAVNVSISELNQLTLPNPALLAELINEGNSIDDAVNKAFSRAAE
jgi:adenine-specific DNA-methyltransferase